MPKTERSVTAAEKAGDILARYGQSGPRDSGQTINRLLAVLDRDAVGEALEQLEERKHGR